MTKQTIEVPRVGESISEVTIGQLLVQNGERVKAGQELLELETDKVNQVLYAPIAGTVHWNVKMGDTVAVGSALGVIEGVIEGEIEGVTEGSGESAGTAAKEKEAPKAEKKPSPPQAASQTASAAEGALIRKTKEDTVRELQEKKTTQTPQPAFEPSAAALFSSPPSPSPSPPKTHEERAFAIGQPQVPTRTKLSRVRRVIAERMVESQRNTATLTTFNEVDMSAIMALRARYKEDFMKKYQVKLGFLSFFVKATVSALRLFPSLHAFIEGDELVQNHHYDISIAVGTDRGLLVPVVRACDQLSFAQIEQTLEDLAKRAREGKIKPDELQGGSFTITNGGVYGSLLSTPILNTPQSGILGMHKIEDRPIALNNQVVIRPMMYLALSYDHRITDGREAVGFLVHVKNCLEDPSHLLLQV